jgi:hypothetical protein
MCAGDISHLERLLPTSITAVYFFFKTGCAWAELNKCELAETAFARATE